MANEFIIRKGYKSLAASEITGSLSATGKIIVGEGSQSAPTLTFNGFTDTGIYRAEYTSGKDQITFTVDGSNRARIFEAGVEAFGNLYFNGDVRTFGSLWHATAGVTGVGFRFENTADSKIALDLDVNGNAKFLGNLMPSTDGGGTLGVGTGTNLRWGGLELQSGAGIQWQNGDARIIEGLVNNYSLSFQTYDGSTNSTALRLDGDNTATFAGQAIIKQPADNLGLRIEGYDDEAGSTIQLKMDASGHARLSQTTDGSSGYLFLQAENYLQLIAGTFVYTQNQIRIYDEGSIAFGSHGDFLAKYYDSSDEFRIVETTTGTKGLRMDTDGNVIFTDDVTIQGNLTLTGDINTETVNNLDVVDKLITLGKGQSEANSNGSGILVDGSNASLLWDESNNTWDFNKSLDVVGNIAASGNFSLADNQMLLWGGNSILKHTGTVTEIGDNSSSSAVSITGGRVGIGTSPASGVKLHVNGEIRVDSTDGVATRKIRSSYFSSTTDIRVEAGSAGDVILGDSSAARLTLASDDSATFAGNVTSQGYLQSYNILYLRNNIQLLNKAGNGWLTFANRDTSGTEAVYNLAHIGTLSTSGNVTIGSDTNEQDFIIYGNDTGEKLMWDGSESRLVINHDTDDFGLGIFTVSSAQMTQPQLKVGRDASQYWGVYTADRDAHLVHRQDETSGIMTTRFDQWDSNTSDTTGKWEFRSGDGTGGSMTTALTLDQSGAATFSNSIDLTAGQVKLRSDVALDHDGSSLYIKAPSAIYFYPGNANKGNINTSGTLTLSGGVSASSGTGHFSLVNASAYQLNGTYIVDSSRNLVNIGTITASGVVNIANNLSLTGDSRILNLAGGSSTNSQSRLIIGEQGVYGVSFRWDSGSDLQFDGFWNSSVTGTRNRDLGSVDVNNRRWNFENTVEVGGSVTAGSFVKSGGTSSQFLMADGSVSTGGGISNVVEDTSPQLGADLDMNGNSIFEVSENKNSIDLKDHSSYTWLRNEQGGWVFQQGNAGDNWTLSFNIFLPAGNTAGNNDQFMQLGQRSSNATNGSYKGTRIVQYKGGVVDGQLKASLGYFSGDTVEGVTDTNNAGIFLSSANKGVSGLFGSSYARNLIKSDGSSTIEIGQTTSLISNIILNAGSSASNGTISFKTKNAERMRVHHDGKVGIGTTSPTGQLDIVNSQTFASNKNSASTGLLSLYNSNNAGGAGIIFCDNVGSSYNASQKGSIAFYHSDSVSQGGGASFHIASTEPNLAVIAGSSSQNGRFLAKSGASNTLPDFSFFDDPNTGMLRTAADNLRLITGGTTALHIDNNQKVGIGTTSPIAKFEVTDGSSSITLQEYGNGAAIFLDGVNGDFTGGDYFHILADGSSYLGLGGYGGGATPLNISNAGRVGIGTTGPGAKLEVGGANAAIWINPADGAHAGLHFRQADTFKGFVGYNDTNDVVNLSMDGSITNGLNVNSSHNVGIGTSSPTDKLDVAGAARFTSNISFDSSKAGRIYKASNHGLAFHGVAGSENDLALFSPNGQLRIVVPTGTSNVILNRDSGNVGIGTSSPAELLEVDGSIKLGSMKLQNVSAGGRIGFNRNTANGAIYNSSYEAFQVQSNGSGYLETQAYNSSGAYQGSMYFTTAGNLGLSTSSPGAKLDVEAGTLGSTSGDEKIATIIRAGRQNIVFKDTRTANGSDWNNATFKIIAQIDSTNHQSIDFVNDSSYAEHIDIRTGNQVFHSRFTAGGRLGIGTTSPSEPLDVVGTARMDNAIVEGTLFAGTSLAHWGDGDTNIAFATDRITQKAGNVEFIDFANTTQDYITLGGSGDIDARLQGGSGYVFIQGSNGYIGINDATPSFPLDISGNTKVSGNLTVSSNIGIGTDSPSYKLQVQGTGYINETLYVNGQTTINDDLIVDHNIIGNSKNFATSNAWASGSGTQTGYYGGNFSGDSQGIVKYDVGPFGARELIQETVPDSGNDYDGGWNKTITDLDINKSHLSVVYVKRTTSQSSGNFYHGTGTTAGQILNLSGTNNTNPYFTATGVSILPENVWCVSIGIIQANHDSNTTTSGQYNDRVGIYRLDTGQKLSTASTYKFGSSGATLTNGHRVFLYYSTDNATTLQFARPGFYEMNGDAPTFESLVGRPVAIQINSSGTPTLAANVTAAEIRTLIGAGTPITDFVSKANGGTFSDDVTIDGGTSTTFSVKCDDAGQAMIRANGDGQGTGILEVGQSNSYGGGISYNGDSSPSFVSGETSDNITFYRLDNGTRTEVFHYPYNSNTVNFNAVPTFNGTTAPQQNHDNTGELRAINFKVLNGGVYYAYSSAGNIRGRIYATETNDEHLVIRTSDSEDIAFKDGTTTNVIMRGDGNVWIRGDIVNVGAVTATGNVTHTGLTMTSGTDVDQLTTVNMTYQLAANTWTDTGINSSELATGTYAIQLSVDDHNAGGGHYDVIYSGMMSWYGSGTNSTNFDEIVLHRVGHATNNSIIQLRTLMHSSGGDNVMLQIKQNFSHSAAMSGTTDGRRHNFKFRRLI